MDAAWPIPSSTATIRLPERTPSQPAEEAGQNGDCNGVAGGRNQERGRQVDRTRNVAGQKVWRRTDVDHVKLGSMHVLRDPRRVDDDRNRHGKPDYQARTDSTFEVRGSKQTTRQKTGPNNTIKSMHVPRRLCMALVLMAALTALGAAFSHGATSRPSRYYVFVEPKAGQAPVLGLIRSARHSVRLVIYELTDQHIFSALGRDESRHVSVRVLLEEHPYGGGRYAESAYHELRSAGINVKWANEGAFTYTHEKALVVDNRTAGIFTLNLSYSGFSSNREFGVIDRNRNDARQIGALFEADWNREPAPVPRTTGLVISPSNSRKALTHLIDRAHHSLILYEEEMDDGPIESQLIRAAHRGVRVRLITSTDSSGVERIRSRGVHVEIMGSPYVHAKAIVADGSRIFIGSENISSTSLDHNREMGIILDGRAEARPAIRTFASDWNASGGGTSPPPSHGKLTLRASVSPKTVQRGQLLTITAATGSGARCTIRVIYPDGYVSHAAAHWDHEPPTARASPPGLGTWAAPLPERVTRA